MRTPKTKALVGPRPLPDPSWLISGVHYETRPLLEAINLSLAKVLDSQEGASNGFGGTRTVRGSLPSVLGKRAQAQYSNDDQNFRYLVSGC